MNSNWFRESFILLKSLLIIFAFLAAGELIVYLIAIPIPGNILGMFLIFFALKLNLISLKDVKPASDQLMKYLVLFFIPYGVGLMSYFGFIKDYWFAISIAVILSTLLTLYVTGAVLQKMEK